MRAGLEACAWPAGALGQLIDALAGAAGLPAGAGGTAEGASPPLLCEARGLEWGRVELTGAGAAGVLAVCAPAVVELPGGGWIGILSGGRRLTLLGRGLERVKMGVRDTVAPFEEAWAAGRRGEAERVARLCGLEGRARERVAGRLLREQMAGEKIGEVYELRTPPQAPVARQAAGAGIPGRAAVFLGSHIAETLLFALSWVMAGRGALTGRMDAGWLWAWALAILTMIPLRLVTTWSQGQLAAAFGGLLKQRLLAGTLRMSADLMRHEGAGRFLARVLEAEALESLALGGGLATVLALAELGVTACILLYNSPAALAVFCVWTLVVFGLAWRYARLRLEWTRHRLELACGMVEQMNGHRTRLAQELEEFRHREEDRALETYLRLSARMDSADVALLALAPRGWLVAGMAVLLGRFLGAAEPAALAAGLGGVLLGQLAFKRLAHGLAQLAGAWIAWREVREMFGASTPAAAGGESGAPEGEAETVVEAHDITFRYPGRETPVLRGASLRIRRGDFVLLEGESGGGKSTLAAILAGLRAPSSGALMSGGVDRHTLGERAWRKRMACAPQYHENHVLAAPFVFNLLMGREWPPRKEDVAEAEAVCRELGLGPLIERMPGGMWQMVGETGWQLSQGERSRLFMARALLQGGDLVILDESFAALDPGNLKQALECVLRRARTLLVVAHP